MRSSRVKTAIWEGDRLFVVEDIPAQVCDSCLEQFYDDEITDAIRRLMEGGFPSAKVKREILVPIFSLDGRIAPETEASLAAEASRW
jgi:YgiT-type zinc finger domain-containing protein